MVNESYCWLLPNISGYISGMHFYCLPRSRASSCHLMKVVQDKKLKIQCGVVLFNKKGLPCCSVLFFHWRNTLELICSIDPSLKKNIDFETTDRNFLISDLYDSFLQLCDLYENIFLFQIRLLDFMEGNIFHSTGVTPCDPIWPHVKYSLTPNSF